LHAEAVSAERAVGQSRQLAAALWRPIRESQHAEPNLERLGEAGSPMKDESKVKTTSAKTRCAGNQLPKSVF
jgi:hypothetical protein